MSSRRCPSEPLKLFDPKLTETFRTTNRPGFASEARCEAAGGVLGSVRLGSNATSDCIVNGSTAGLEVAKRRALNVLRVPEGAPPRPSSDAVDETPEPRDVRMGVLFSQPFARSLVRAASAPSLRAGLVRNGGVVHDLVRS